MTVGIGFKVSSWVEGEVRSFNSRWAAWCSLFRVHIVRLMMSLVRLHVPQSVIEIVNIFNSDPFVDLSSIMGACNRNS